MTVPSGSPRSYVLWLAMSLVDLCSYFIPTLTSVQTWAALSR